MRLARRIALGALLVLVVLIVIAAPLASGGVWMTRSSKAVYLRRPGLPAWTRACRLAAISSNTTVCAYVKGRIVWVQHHDPDGDGDRHIAVVTRFHLRLIKIPIKLGVGKLPGRGSEITAVGYDLRGASDRQEVDASRVVYAGHTYVRGTRPVSGG